jgi:transposase-like protein
MTAKRRLRQMPQHFLLSPAARTLTLASVARMSDEEAERVFVRLRWADNKGDAYCPHCGCPTVYAARRPNGAPRWRCKACRKDFSVTSGTLFANRREDRKDRRLRQNLSGKRKVVVVIRERGGKTLPGVFRNEADALTFIRQRVAPQTTLYADEAGSWNALAARFTLHRIDHGEAYSLQDALQTHTNNAEGFFSRMRRGEIGHHHHVAGPYLLRFAQEAAWREDHKREANGSQVDRIVALAMANKPSVDFCGYWQRSRTT